FDLQQHPPEVAPTAHCLLGGVVVNENGEAGVPGLYAVGEVAGGIHGAGMLPGNALAAALVFGRRVGVASSEWVLKTAPPAVDGEQVDADMKRAYGLLEDRNGPRVSLLRKQLQVAMWNNCGPVRSRHGLNSVLEQISKWRSTASSSFMVENKSQRHNREWIEALELENMLMVAEAMLKSALERRESRGVHYRSDHTRLNNHQYFVNIQTRQLNGEIIVESKPVAVKYVTQPSGEFMEGEPS
ncbi:MAG: FAD-binding protein, partial [Candidatus Bathyarchaeia archaeon]